MGDFKVLKQMQMWTQTFKCTFRQALKCYYDQNLMSRLSQKRFLFRLSEVAVPVSVIEMNFGAL